MLLRAALTLHASEAHAHFMKNSSIKYSASYYVIDEELTSSWTVESCVGDT